MAGRCLTVIVLSNVPEAVKGYTSAYFIQVSPGVFVGKVSAKVRDLLWDKLSGLTGIGAASLVHSNDSEQGFVIRTRMSNYEDVDFDGITLIEHHPYNRATRLGLRRLDSAPDLEN